MSGPKHPAAVHLSPDEPLLFECSAAGKRAVELAPLDVPPVDAAAELGAAFRRTPAALPEISEVEVVRHYTRLSTWNYALDHGMYPLGSCTMKYNPRVNEAVAALEGLATAHPYLPDALAQGALRIMYDLSRALAEITGLDAVSLQPAAGAHGELTGVLVLRAALQARGDARRIILIPDSAHGTNPATAAMAGYQVQAVASDERGMISLADLAAKATDEVAGLMLTNPNTLGIFEEQIGEIAAILHQCGALLYLDGANLNALVGRVRPGDFGVDVMHLNLHKTFSTPHGGGGPGAGPIACRAELEPFLPRPAIVERADRTLALDYARPQSIGRVRAFCGNFSIFVRALAYIQANGAAGLRQTTEDAVLNNNYLRHKLEGLFELPYATPTLHETVFSDKRQQRPSAAAMPTETTPNATQPSAQAPYAVHAMDLAKRLIDYGFHPPTVAFPLIVPGALMIEPTESESRAELDRFAAAMQSIAREAAENPEIFRHAPHSTRRSRLDEVQAARHPILRWRPTE